MTTLIPKFQQTGTGAVNRPFTQKLAETVSVKDFGAVGDGVTDDTTAFINAVATGSTVLIPANTTIRIATAITSTNLTTPFNVVGESRDTSIIYFDVNGVGLQTTNSNARSQWSNLSIKGNLSNANSAGLDLFDNSSRTLDRLNVYDFSKTAIKITQSVSPILNDLRIYSVGTGVELSPGATSTISPSILNVYVSSATIQGINISGSCAHGVISNYICETSVLGLNAVNCSVELTDSYFEANTKDTAYADSQIIERSTVSTTSFAGSTNSYSGAIASYRRFLFKDGNYYTAIGGMYNADARFNSVINTWESLLFSSAFLSPFVNPNPGAISPAVINIITPGLYEIEYSVTWGTASAVAGYGNTRVINGATEIPGSFATTYLPATATIFSTVTRKFIAELASNANLTFQFGASSDQIQVRANGGGGPAPTSTTNATWTIRYLSATSALTL